MRVAIFTDTYFPSINGIVFVTQSLKENLEQQGHEVYVFCPARSIRPNKQAQNFDEDEHVIRFPSVKGAFYDDYDTSFFFPPRVLMQVKRLDLDMVMILTPGQVGLMGIQAAWRTKTPFVIQHCTDVYEFAEHYPAALPGVLALMTIIVPFTVKLAGHDVKELIKMYKPRRGATKWNRELAESGVNLIYSKADAVVALSRKSKEQLTSWQKNDNYRYDIDVLPSGVPAVPKASKLELTKFRERYGIADDDQVFGFVGRLAEEKNLPLLIKSLPSVVRKHPKARLMFVGDFEYREALEEMAQKSPFADRITFTGAIDRQKLGAAYQSMSIFTFPSLKDTQGWVIHEAAHAKLPIILIDRQVSEIVVDGESGLFAKDSAKDMADKINYLLDNPDIRQKLANNAQKYAAKFTEKRQTKKLETLFMNVLRKRNNA